MTHILERCAFPRFLLKAASGRNVIFGLAIVLPRPQQNKEILKLHDSNNKEKRCAQLSFCFMFNRCHCHTFALHKSFHLNKN